MRAAAEGARDLIAEVTDDNVDLADAAVTHDIDLMRQQRTVEDRENRLGTAFREGIHPRAFPGGEDDANHPVIQFSRVTHWPPCIASAPASRVPHRTRGSS